MCEYIAHAFGGVNKKHKREFDTMTNTIELNYLNLGSMAFDTLVLPSSEEEINEFFAVLNPMDSDVELQWVEFDFSPKGNYNDLSLNELKELSEIADLQEFDMVYYACDSFDEALTVYQNSDYIIYNECVNDYDLGYFIAEDMGLISANDDSIIVRYFDYDAYGRDCRLEGNYTQYDYDTCVCILY
jgi:antirestriction protein